jgi:3D (Asp-Asp-Asp) domain-containing protein
LAYRRRNRGKEAARGDFLKNAKEVAMAGKKFVLYLFLLFTGGPIILSMVQADPWKTKNWNDAIRLMPPPEAAEELDRTRHQLQRALGLLEKCFGQNVDLNQLKSTQVTITAYSSTEDQCDSTPYITASMHPVRIGTLAVSPDLLEELGLFFGQRVLIPGFGLFEVRDTMNPRWRRRVDIWESNPEAARRFGKQKGTLIWTAEKSMRAEIASSSLN